MSMGARPHGPGCRRRGGTSPLDHRGPRELVIVTCYPRATGGLPLQLELYAVPDDTAPWPPPPSQLRRRREALVLACAGACSVRDDMLAQIVAEVRENDVNEAIACWLDEASGDQAGPVHGCIA